MKLAESPSRPPLKLVLIGAGNHSRSSHAPSLAKYMRDHPGQIELSGVCDLDEGKARSFQEEFGFREKYLDVEKMIRNVKPHGCICVMPVSRVAEVGIKLLQLGIPTLLEKPPGASIDEVRRLGAAAQDTGVPVMVSLNRRFDPCLVRALEWARSQEPFVYVRGAMMRHQRTEFEFIWATGFHCVDALRAIGGEVVRDTVEVMSDSEATWFRLNLVFESGTVGALDVLPTCGCTDESYDILGNGFRAEVRVASSSQPGIRLWRDGEVVADECLPCDLSAFVRGGTFAETEEFIQALMEGRPPRPSVEDALPSAEICFAAARSASNFPEEAKTSATDPGSPSVARKGLTGWSH